MYKCLLIFTLIWVAASDENLVIFNPDLKIFTDCIEQLLANVDDIYQLSRIAKPVADLAARRFRGKSLSRNIFHRRFQDFFYQLRNDKINHNINQDDIPDLLKSTLKEILLLCAVNNPLSADITTLQKGKSADLTLQDKEWISFNQNKNLLSDCIKNHLKLTGYPEFQENDEFTEFIADCTAGRICGKSFTKTSFLKSLTNLFFYLRNSKTSHYVIEDTVSAEIGPLVKIAAEDCAENKLPLVAVPVFEIEPTEAAQLLDLILVKWPVDPHVMIKSQLGRAILRRYTNDALTAVTRELNICQNKTQVFRLVLLTYWNNRAREMFDASFLESPYIEHSYTLNYPTPHMVLSDFEIFINRKSRNFKARNPLESKSNVKKIVNIHRRVHFSYRGGIDFFGDYNKKGMTSAEYYLENQLNQFYRIIFFFLELCAVGICTDEDDNYKGLLPNNLVPKQIQKIIYDDDAYRDYLLDQRSFYKMLMDDSQNEIAQNLFRNARVLEENLILLKSCIPSTSGTQFINKSVNEVTERSIKTSMHSLKRKDDVWKNENGKCFPSKRVKTTAVADSNGSVNKSDTENLNHVSISPIQISNNYSVTDAIFEIPTIDSESLESFELDDIMNNIDFGYFTFDENYSYLSQFSSEDLLLFEEIAQVPFLSDEHYSF